MYYGIMKNEVWCFSYNLLHCPQVIFSKRIVCKHTMLRNVRFHVAKNAYVRIQSSILSNCEFFLFDEGCKLEIGKQCRIRNTRFYIQDPYSSIVILDNFTIGGGEIASTESCRILIGEDCMFSEDIEIRNGDSHAIVASKEPTHRINQARDVVIGNHCWLTAHTRIMKGVTIPNNCIIANSAVVTSSLPKSHALYGGVPAKLLKEGIDWKRSRY